MRTDVDDLLCSEISRYRLRFTCEHCAHFDEEGRAEKEGACSQGFPSREHRSTPLRPGDTLVFCKMFEAS